MCKLLREGIRRYSKSVVFWAAVIATVIISVLGALRIRRDGIFDDIWFVAEWAAVAVLIPILIGTQFGEGIFRNKVISGHSKTSIYFSEVVLGIGATIVLLLISASVYFLIASNALGAFSAEVLIKLLIGIVLMHISVSVLCILISTLVSHRAVSPIICILLVFGLMMVAYKLDDTLNQPQYFYEMSFNFETGEWIETEEKVENDRYIDGVERDICSAVIKAIPHGQMLFYTEIIHEHTYFYISYPGDEISIEKEALTALNTYPLYSVVFITLLILAGYICFRKKEMK